LIWDSDGTLRSFDLIGTPTEFSDIIEGRTNPVRVTAPRIVYDGEVGTLKMPGMFQLLEDGAEGNWGNGCDLTYWLMEKRYAMGTPECPSVLSLAPTEAKDSGETRPDEP
jgi:lipopolysaccharide export system protein LptA